VQAKSRISSMTTGLLYVPVHTCAPGTVSIQVGRLPSGQEVGLGFTSAGRLARVFGPAHPWIRLHLGALHEMLEPLGISLVRVDPLRPPARRGPAPRPSPTRGIPARTAVPARALAPAQRA
jgi:hypothetical protein